MASVTITAIEDYSDANGNAIIGRADAEGTKVEFKAKNCKLVIGNNVSLPNCVINFACDGGLIEIGDGSRYTGQLHVGHRSSIHIGKSLYVTWGCYVNAAEGSAVRIGDDCMFASSNQIRGTDHHPIFDVKTGLRINTPRDIAIGNHVWLGISAIVLGGGGLGTAV